MDVEHEMEIYYYRREQECALVRIYGVDQIKKKDAPLCGVGEQIKVIT
jgi:hypothetical protein